MFFLFNSEMRMADEVKTAMKKNASLTGGTDKKLGFADQIQEKKEEILI